MPQAITRPLAGLVCRRCNGSIRQDLLGDFFCVQCGARIGI